MPAMPRREVQGASPAIKSVLPGLLSLREGGKGQAGGTTGEAQMKVLIACEYSGRTRQAFRDLGHDAWSCDLLESEDNSPHHIQGDVLPILQEPWDLVIAHPPCTYLAVSGMHWTARGLRDPQLTEDALDFVRALMAAQSPRTAIENPISVISSRIRKPDQIIQPWWFGDDASKKTCLWLKGLPPLVPNINQVVPPKGWARVMGAADMLECESCGEPYCPECDAHYAECECIGPPEDEAFTIEIDGFLFGTRIDPPPRRIWGNQTPSGQNKLGPSADRWKERSRTYPGIARAFAEQWGGL